MTAADPKNGGTLRGKRLLVVEEAMKGPVGHWFEYVKAVSELNRAEGVEVDVVCHRDAEDSIRRELNLHSLFPRTNWDNVYAHPKAWRRYLGIIRHNWLVYRTMNRFVKEHGPYDCLFAPTVVIFHLGGWRLLMARHGGRRIGRMVLFFRNNAGAYVDGSPVPIFKRSTAVLKWLIRSFRPWLARGKVEFATDSARLAREYHYLSGITPTEFPSPRIAPPDPGMYDPRDPAKPITFACLGPARFEKGIDVMQDAIRDYLAGAAGDANVRFVIQWNAEILDEHGNLYEPDPALVADRRVDFIRHAMDSAEYDAVVADTDVMLLPYRRESYYARISGVAVEAVTSGTPVIYTRDTWCEDLVTANGAGVGAENNDSGDLQRAIAETVARYAELRQAALDRAESAREAHGGGTFLQRLWGTG